MRLVNLLKATFGFAVQITDPWLVDARYASFVSINKSEFNNLKCHQNSNLFGDKNQNHTSYLQDGLIFYPELN
jgi:hypothetical protein